MGSLMEWRIYKHYLPRLLYWRHSLKISEFHVNHQHTWILSASNVKVQRFEANCETKVDAKIRCRLYQNTAAPLNNKLIVLMHGGGFIIGTPESHDVSRSLVFFVLLIPLLIRLTIEQTDHLYNHL